MNTTLRHAKIVVTVLITLVVSFGIHGVLALTTFALSGSDFDGEKNQYQQEQALNEFWLGIAAQQPIDGNDPSDQLARRLGEMMGPIGQTGDFPALDFSAEPKVYRGINDELGFDPFVSEACSICGGLTQYMQESLRAIKAGNVNQLLIETQPPVDNTDWSVSGIPMPIELIVTFLVAGSLGMFIGLRLFGDPNMTWERGDGLHEREELYCMIMAPLFMFIFLSFVNKRRLAELNKNREDFLRQSPIGSELSTIRAAIAMIESLPEEQRNDSDNQQALRMLQVEERELRTFYDRVVASQGDYRHEEVRTEVSGRVSAAVEQSQAAREGYMKILEGLRSDSVVDEFDDID